MGMLELYVCDTETTGKDRQKHDIIELSLFRLSDDKHQTWKLRPTDFSCIEQEALNVNKFTIEDLKNKEIHKELSISLPDIENWITEDGCAVADRVLVGHNIQFDFDFMYNAWTKMECFDSFPFMKYGNLIDTKGLVLLYDVLYEQEVTKYGLSKCVKRFGLQKRSYHGASEDVLATKDLFDFLCKKFKDGNK